eukprot:c21698_g1_i1.p1 GENE.c21698_g1_i1~~c21698_g1_i1.p1  ORF type:complete len:371 (+),score=164.58 c21698_g1_i1:1-1113(+)
MSDAVSEYSVPASFISNGMNDDDIGNLAEVETTDPTGSSFSEKTKTNPPAFGTIHSTTKINTVINTAANTIANEQIEILKQEKANLESQNTELLSQIQHLRQENQFMKRQQEETESLFNETKEELERYKAIEIEQSKKPVKIETPPSLLTLLELSHGDIKEYLTQPASKLLIEAIEMQSIIKRALGKEIEELEQTLEEITVQNQNQNQFACSEYVNLSTIDIVFGDKDIGDLYLVKADVEGFEWQALQGAMNILKKHKPCAIEVEFVSGHSSRVGDNTKEYWDTLSNTLNYSPLYMKGKVDGFGLAGDYCFTLRDAEKCPIECDLCFPGIECPSATFHDSCLERCGCAWYQNSCVTVDPSKNITRVYPKF